MNSKLYCQHKSWIFHCVPKLFNMCDSKGFLSIVADNYSIFPPHSLPPYFYLGARWLFWNHKKVPWNYFVTSTLVYQYLHKMETFLSCLLCKSSFFPASLSTPLCPLCTMRKCNRSWSSFFGGSTKIQKIKWHSK